METLLKQHLPFYYKNYIKQELSIKKHRYKKLKEIEKYFYCDINNRDMTDTIKKMSQKMNRIYKLDENIICTWYEQK